VVDGLRNEVFISYSHRDRRWLTKLKTILTPLVRDRVISVWEDAAISPGGKWKAEIEAALCRASAAILLVSDNFLASDFIATNELPKLLESAEESGVKIFWIALSACLYKGSAIAEYQAANDPARPLDTLRAPEAKRTLVDIGERIAAIAKLPLRPTTRRSDDEGKLARWGDYLLGYAYHFENDGRKDFMLIDVMMNWEHAYRKFLEGQVETNGIITALVSYLPRKTDEDGNTLLDLDNCQAALDQLVASGYLTRTLFFMGDKYTITAAGRAFYSRSKDRIFASMDPMNP
jgi:hypothetical protein